MKPKQYKLLKDLPDAKAGTIYYFDGLSLSREIIASSGFPELKVKQSLPAKWVDDTDFFQLIEEKEFTESDMIKFARFYWDSERNISDIKMDFQEWLTQRNND